MPYNNQVTMLSTNADGQVYHIRKIIYQINVYLVWTSNLLCSKERGHTNS